MKDILINILSVISITFLVGALVILAHIFISSSVDNAASIEHIEAKLDSIAIRLDKIDAATDTIYVDVDDMSQADWRSYTPTDKD